LKTSSDNELFNLATKSRGGLYTSSDFIFETTKLRSEQILIGYNLVPELTRPMPKIIYNFVDNDEVNAFATKINDSYIIAVHKGLVETINNVFKSMAVNPKVFTGLKTSEQRHFYAMHLSSLALDFILEHEFSHIICGHLDFLKEKFSISEISELVVLDANNDIKGQANHDLQVFEMDADCTALSRIAIWAKNMIERGLVGHFPDFLAQFWGDLFTVWGDMFIAISVVFRLFGDGKYWNTSTHSSSHPNSRVRQLILANTYREINNQFDVGFNTTDIWDMLSKKREETDSAFELATGEETNLEVFKPEYLAEHPALKTLQKTWRERLRQELEPFTYIKLAD